MEFGRRSFQSPLLDLPYFYSNDTVIPSSSSGEKNLTVGLIKQSVNVQQLYPLRTPGLPRNSLQSELNFGSDTCFIEV